MRPVERGACPPGLNIQAWGDALKDLVERMGEYCSYCELPLPNGAQVEHVKPKKHFAADALNWDNFLLACGYCNGTKRDNPQDDLVNYRWPDRDNLLCYLQYDLDCVPKAHAGDVRTQNTLIMLGLQRDDSSKPRATKKDVRWRKRRDAWFWALRMRNHFDKNPALLQIDSWRDALQLGVQKTGFFSVWMAAFHDVPEVKELIVLWFPGTPRACFDAQVDPLPRP